MAKITKRMKILTITSVILILSSMISSQNINVNQKDLLTDNFSSSPYKPSTSDAGIAYLNHDKITYMINDEVKINGYNFNPEAPITIIISRPCCCGEHPYHIDTIEGVITDISGTFEAYYTNTISKGFYNITATDGINSAKHVFAVSSCSIWTDKDNYAPEETVIIYGTKFNPNAKINITLLIPNNTTDTWEVYADDHGNFTMAYILDGIQGAYYLIATDDENTAAAVFHDFTPNPQVTLYNFPQCQGVYKKGDSISVRGKDFWGHVKIWVGGPYYGGILIKDFYQSDTSDGTFTKSFPVPPSISEGDEWWVSVKSWGNPYKCYYGPHEDCGCKVWFLVCWEWYQCTHCHTYYYREMKDHAPFWVAQLPIISAYHPYSGYVNQPVQFLDTGSYDPDGYIATYSWSFGDETHSNEASPLHTYTSPGTYYTTYVIWDNHNYPATFSSYINIKNRNPVAKIICPSLWFIGNPVQFDGTTSYDPDGLELVSWTWDFGDGTTGGGPSPQHTYSSEGTYTVNLIVEDNFGATHSTSKSIEITVFVNTPPIADAGGIGPYDLYWGSEGDTITFDASGSIDAPGGDPLQYRWDFDNNGIWDTEWDLNPIASYTWYDGFFGKAKVEVYDGEFSDTDTATVNIYNRVPIVYIGPALTVDKNEPIIFSPTVTDPGDDDFTYSWDFESDGIIDSDLESPIHAYSEPGTYTVKLKVIDNNGGIGIGTCKITVTDTLFHILIDDTDPTMDWAYTAANNGWCTGSGTPEDPYIIEGFTVDGEYSVECIVIRNSLKYFIIRNCEVLNSKVSGTTYYFGGIRLVNVQNGELQGNIVRNNEIGIYLISSHNNIIRDNMVENNKAFGIMLKNSDNNEILGNQAIGTYGTGIDLGSYGTCDNNKVIGNIANNNRGRGIKAYGINNIIDANSVSHNYIGMTIEGRDVTISNNIISHCSSYGLQLHFGRYFNINNNKISYTTNAIYTYKHHGSIIISNELYGNKVGINLHESDNNQILENYIHDNTQDGIRIHSGCNDNIFSDNVLEGNSLGVNSHSSSNLFYNNEFISNTINAVDEGSNNQWDNGIIGNYWDDYPFYDADDDEIGDKPFSIPGAALSQDNFPIWDDGPGIPDTIPPVTEISLEGTLEPEGWYSTDVSVTLSATDNFAGVLETKYRIDGGSWILYDTAFTISKEGDTLIEFYSIDYFDNIESIKSSQFKIVKAPEVEAGDDQTVYEGASVLFDGSYIDPEDTSDHTIFWDFGDGNTATGTLNPTHEYKDNDIYIVTLIVEDGYGGIGSDTLTITVNNVAPTLSDLLATSIDEGDFSTLSGTIIDPSILDTFTLTVDWGDASSIESFNFLAGTTSFSLTHQYLDDGIYTITLTVIDDDGGSGTGNLIVTVFNVAPILTISGDPDVDEGSLYTLYLDSYDPGDDYIYQWIIDWGDGNSDTITGDPSTATHVYADGFNTYIISAIASDEDGTYTNFGFELGDFTDWDVYIPWGGSANVVNSHTGYLGTLYSPMGGSYFALLKTDGAGSYSTLQMTFDLLAGQIISGWAAFDARDYIPYNDNAAVRILDEFGALIDTVWYCDVNIVGNYGDSPWEQWSWTAPTSGNYIIEYRIANNRDSVLDSYALFDGEIGGLDVVVNNIAPTLTLSGSLEVDEGSIYVLNLDSYDPGDDTIYQWVINWGDGFVDTITEYPSSITHTYADGPNTYIISAIASDEDGTYGLLGPNSGFEMGDFATWDVYIPPGGSANVVNAHTGYLGTSYSPMGGNYFALLKTDGAGSYSTLQMTFDLLAGQIISGWAAFDARDYSPFNDNAAVRILDEFGVLIDTVWYCDVNIVGNYGDSPWEQWSWTAPTSGNYIIEYRIANNRDSVLDSFALFDSEFVSLPLILVVNNVVPTVDAGPDLIVDEDTTYPYLWSFTDPGILDTHTAVIYWGDGSTEAGTVVEIDGDGTVSGDHMYTLPGFYTVTITVTDKDGGVGSDTLIVEVLDITPPISTLFPLDPYYEEEDIYYVSTATLFSFSAEDGEMDFGLGLLQYRLDDDVDWIEYEGSETTFTVTEIGPHTVYYRSIDVAGNEEEIKSIEIVVNASELTYLVGFEGTYSDPVNLEAYLMDIATGLPIPGKTIVFTLGTQIVTAKTDFEGFASFILVLDQIPGDGYTVSASFAEDEEYLGSDSEIWGFTINKEHAYAEYTGDMVVPLNADFIYLRATVFDEDDGTWGDLTKIYVTITILNSMTLLPLESYPSLLLQVETIVDGVGIAKITILNDLPEGDYIVQISFDPDENDYYCGDNSYNTLIIYEPTGDFVTGGGWIEDSNGNKGNFGFNVKYKKNGLPKGQAIYIYREGDYVFIVKANAWVGMAIISDENYAIFEAKCNVKKIHAESGVIVWEEGNYRLIIEVWDNSEDGKEDVFQLRVYDRIGVLYHEAGFDPYGFLGGGNIVIHIDKKK